MDPITLVVTALAAGAAAALQDGTKDAVKTAYARLRDKLRRRVEGRPDAELALARHETAPGKWEALLAAELTEAGAAGDAGVVDAAQALMKLIDETGSRAGKYVVNVQNARGIQIGDLNTQTNAFGG
jgi:hypothetical protein